MTKTEKRKTKTVKFRWWGVIDGGGGLRSKLHFLERDAEAVKKRDTKTFRALGPHRVVRVTLTYQVPK